MANAPIALAAANWMNEPARSVTVRTIAEASPDTLGEPRTATGRGAKHLSRQRVRRSVRQTDRAALIKSVAPSPRNGAPNAKLAKMRP